MHGLGRGTTERPSVILRILRKRPGRWSATTHDHPWLHMNSHVVRSYQALPYPLRVALASARGWRLERQRFGSHTEQLVAAVHKRERWSSEQWEAYVERRLTFILTRAATRVPFYRDQWQARGRAGDDPEWSDLTHWPVLRKADLRDDPPAFVADDRDRRRLVADHTSGTTGTSLTVWANRAAVQEWNAL